jgi:putative DNA primase/helicase
VAAMPGLFAVLAVPAKYAEQVQRLAEISFPPSADYIAGAQAYLYWLLEEPLDLTSPEGRSEVERLLAAISWELDGDLALAGIGQFLPLPAPMNLPRDPSRRAGVIRCEATRRYSLAAFKERLASLRGSPPEPSAAELTTASREPGAEENPGRSAQSVNPEAPAVASTAPDPRVQVQAAIATLAELSKLEFELQRRAAAKATGLRVSAIDQLVNDARSQSCEAAVEAEPLWPVAVDGATLLDELVSTIRKYVILGTPESHAAALWILFTHCFSAATFSPRLAVTSPEKRCGKTTLLKILLAACPHALPSSNVSVATLYRIIQTQRPTLILDELDSFLPGNEWLRGILNSGHDPQFAFVLRCASDEHAPKSYSTWTPIALGLIGKLPETLEDRSIEIRMRRKLPAEKAERFRKQQIAEIKSTLLHKCARWAYDNLAALRGQEPPPPPEALNDRAADSWEPLFAIAKVAGGAWPERACQAAVALAQANGEGESIHTRLLSDLRMLFGEHGAAAIASRDICEALAQIEDGPWPAFNKGKPLTQAQLARLLKPFGVSPLSIRPEGAPNRTAKGYKLADLQDPFARYLGIIGAPLPSSLSPGGTAAQALGQ